MITTFQQHNQQQQQDVSEASGTFYEANPLASIAEQAGGMALGPNGRILEIEPEGIHQRTPFMVGSKREMEMLVETLARVTFR